MYFSEKAKAAIFISDVPLKDVYIKVFSQFQNGLILVILYCLT